MVIFIPLLFQYFTKGNKQALKDAHNMNPKVRRSTVFHR